MRIRKVYLIYICIICTSAHLTLDINWKQKEIQTFNMFLVYVLNVFSITMKEI